MSMFALEMLLIRKFDGIYMSLRNSAGPSHHVGTVKAAEIEMTYQYFLGYILHN